MKLKAPPAVKKARVEIIPLIDVVFFLLATFVLVSLSMTRLQGLKFDLPSSRSTVTGEEAEVKKVIVLSEGQYSWEEQDVTWSQLVAKLKQYRRESPDPRILITGEEDAPFGEAVAILDEARFHGIGNASIQTKAQASTKN